MIDISQRDKNVLIAGAVCLIIFAAAELLYFPALERKENLQRVLELKTEHYQEMLELKDEFESFSKQNKNSEDFLKKRAKNFSLFSFIDKQVQQCGIKENVAFMKPFSTEIEKSDFNKATVKIKLNNIYLKQLVDFLYKVESSKSLVVISSISLSRTGKKEFLLDAVIEAQTLMAKDSA